MRHLVLALVILLLPLRGWMGDAMATSMAAGQLTVLQAAQKKAATAATENMASHAHEVGAMVHDCGMQSMDAADSADDSGMDCASCASCQACHTVALSPVAEKSIATFNPASQPDAATLPFASADAALSQKPPIS